MHQDILISIIVPVYNVEQFLPKCVDSILNQTYRNLEVILVDDGTKDASNVICDAYAAKDSRVRVIHKENGGLSSARNAGIEIARGEYLGFVDSDDWVERETYEILLAVARKYEAKLVCGGRYDVDAATGARNVGLCPAKEEVVSAETFVGRIFLWDNVDSAACDKLFHRSLFQEVRFPFGKVCEDVPTIYRLALDAGNVALCHKPLYNYYHRPNSITTAKVSEKTFHFAEHTKEIYAFICKHYPALKDRAAYFRVRSLTHSIQSVELAEEESQKHFASKCRQEQRELRKFIGFILRAPWFTTRDRIRNILMSVGLYRQFRNFGR